MGALALALSACFTPVGDGADAATDAASPIGPAGGQLANGEATVWFQPGALATAVHPTLTPYDVTAPPGYRPIGPGWLAGPEGLQFGRAVSLTLPIDGASILPGDKLFVMTAPLGGATFELLDATRLGEQVVAFLWHFSVLLPVTPIRPDAGTVDAGADAGNAVDAGAPDAGAPDAGIDAGQRADAGWDAGVPAGWDGGCRGGADWSVLCGEPTSSTDGGSCRLSAPCAGGARVAQCEHGRCECHVGGVVTSVATGFSNSCFSAWSCVCGFPALCPGVDSAAPADARPGTGQYPFGTSCIDGYDCLDGVCLRTASNSAHCIASCRSAGARCPCGQTCRWVSNLGELCLP